MSIPHKLLKIAGVEKKNLASLQVPTSSMWGQHRAYVKESSALKYYVLFRGEEKCYFLILQQTWDSWLSSSAIEKGLTLKKTFKGSYTYSLKRRKTQNTVIIATF